MAQEILIPNIATANTDLLDQQLKAVAPTDCYGIKADFTGLYIIVSDTITPVLLQQLKTITIAHDPTQDTPAQAAAKTGKADTANMLAAADTAITQLTAKLTQFQGAQTLQNAAPLLIEISQDLIGVIKAMKYVAKHINN